ncbi:putative lipoprotein [Collimonas arenae]|uniref:Putative lipoprotein n=1 Tax=Collimonas arenae TaxID=279058 RepID=A0A127QGC3_9BURK|nr:hypothetical protein [Collimonas arenae]AMO99221.1 putative lipoprotein [Collimonas arenae]AMP09119.1 putative lipoprotein [Collimonas arenae]
MKYPSLPDVCSFSRLATPLLFAALLLGGCTVVSVTSSVVGAGVSVGSAAVGVASTVVEGTVKAGSAVVGAVTD